MDVIRRLRRWAYRRPRVLIVDPAGTDDLRWAVEAEVDRRGWSFAATPAETDLLVVLGAPGPQLSSAVDVLWSQVAGPRHRLRIDEACDVGSALDVAVDALLAVAAGEGGGAEVADAARLLAERAEVPESDAGGDGGAHEGMDHGGHSGMDHEGMDHEGMDHGGHSGMSHDGHEGMDHGGMDHSHHGGMSVAGLPMADTAPDRDGLQLDELRVTLGPVLPGWPTGLVLRGRLQGDVLTDVDLSWIDDAVPPEDPAVPSPVRALDSLMRFLVVAGWQTEAIAARRARAGFSSDDAAALAEARRMAARLARRVGSSRFLAWNLRGTGKLSPSLPQQHTADVLERVRTWCAIAAGEDCPAPAPVPGPTLAAALEGAEIGTARLVLASVPSPRVPAHRPEVSGV